MYYLRIILINDVLFENNFEFQRYLEKNLRLNPSKTFLALNYCKVQFFYIKWLIK